MFALPGLATSQTYDSGVVNGQIQLGDVFADQALNVVTVTDGIAAVTAATGNTVAAAVEHGTLGFTSDQTMNGAAVAQTDVVVGSNAGQSVAITTAATGNVSHTGVVNGVVQGVNTQAVGDTEINARTFINSPTARVGNATVNTQAVANSQTVGLTHGSAGIRANQWNQAEVRADGAAVFQYSPGTGVYTSTAAGNNFSSAGVQGSAAALAVGQHNYADLVTARQFSSHANSQSVTTAATSTGNNSSISNEVGLLDVTNDQENRAYIQAEANAYSYDYGEANVTAYGVGNSSMAGNAGSEVRLDNTQYNGTGGVEVTATFNGHNGYDVSATSTAVGNASTAYACTLCGGTMGVSNSQTNDSNVSARSTVGNTGGARSVVGVASATGNTASYYVTSPGH